MKYFLIASIAVLLLACKPEAKQIIATFTLIDKTTKTPLANIPVVIAPGNHGFGTIGTYYSDQNGKIDVSFEGTRPKYNYYIGCNNVVTPCIPGEIKQSEKNQLTLELDNKKLIDLNFHFSIKDIPYTDMEIALLTDESEKFKYFTQNCDGTTPIKFKYKFSAIYDQEDTVVFKTEENTEAKIQITFKRINPTTGAAEQKMLEYIIPAQPGPITVYQEISLP